MAYKPVNTFTDGQPAPSADWWNLYIRDNMAAMPPDAFTAKGDMLAATGAHAGAIVSVGTNDAYLFAESSAAAGIKWSKLGRLRVVGSDGLGTDGTWKITGMDTTDYDTAAAYASSTNTYTAPHSGYYIAIVSALFSPSIQSGSVNDYARVALYKNGTIYSMVASENIDAALSTIFSTTLVGADLIYLESGDTVELYAITANTNFNGIWMFVGDSLYSHLTLIPLPV